MKRKKQFLLAGGAMILAALIAVVAFFAGASTTPPVEVDTGAMPVLTAPVSTPGKGSAYEAVITSSVPKNPVEVMTTPANEAWWTVIAQVLPSAGLDDLYPGETGVEPVGFAYSLNATQGDNAKSAVPVFPAGYVQTANVEDAQTVTDWLNAQAGSEHRRAWRDGTVIVIVPAWVDPSAELNLDVTSTTADLEGSVGTPDTEAVWTLNVGRYNEALIGFITDDNAQKERAQRLVESLGIGSKSTITVTASDPAGTWTGAARDMNPTGVDITRASNLLSGSSEVKYEMPQGDGTRIVVRDPGMMQLLSYLTVTAWDDGIPAASIGTLNEAANALRPDNATTVLTGWITPWEWQSQMLGRQLDRFGATTIMFSITGDGAVILKPDFMPAASLLPTIGMDATTTAPTNEFGGLTDEMPPGGPALSSESADVALPPTN